MTLTDWFYLLADAAIEADDFQPRAAHRLVAAYAFWASIVPDKGSGK